MDLHADQASFLSGESATVTFVAAKTFALAGEESGSGVQERSGGQEAVSMRTSLESCWPTSPGDEELTRQVEKGKEKRRRNPTSVVQEMP